MTANRRTGAGRFLNAAVSKRILAVISVIWLIAMLLPVFALSFYAYPTHDDFPNVRLASEAWARTGSLLSTMGAAWEQTLRDYNTWQGTFVAMFSCAFQPLAISVELFWLTPVSVLALLMLSAWYLVRQLARCVLNVDVSTQLALYALLMTLLLQYAPGLREMLYWQSAIQYTLSLVMLMFLLGLMLRLHMPQGRVAYALRALAAFLCAFALGGLPYPLALGCTVGMALIAAWCLRRRSPAGLAAVLGFLGILAALVIVVIAPGNYVRQARVGDSMNPVLAVVHSLVESLSCTAGWLGPQTLGAALLMALLLWRPLKSCRVRFRNPGWFSFFSFGVLAASYVPPIYATGVDSYKLDRIVGSLYMLYALLLFLNLAYWLGWLAQRAQAWEMPPVRVWRLGVCAGLLAWGLFANGAVMATPTLSAARSLLTGEAARYHSEILARQEAIARAGSLAEAQSAVQPLSAQPNLLPLDQLVYQNETLLPGDMHRFFRVQELCGQYGAGKIPEAEWQALDAWSTAP